MVKNFDHVTVVVRDLENQKPGFQGTKMARGSRP
jgi:hypothetical protein